MPFDTDTTRAHNIADSLAGLLPRPLPMGAHTPARGTAIQLTALPPGWQMHEADPEKFDATPRATKGKAVLADPASFMDYIKRHQTPATTAWCNFDPQQFSLSFCAVFDDHQPGLPGWRRYRADFTPEHSAEWKVWKAHHGKAMGQVEFAEFLERNADDINAESSVEGIAYPTSLAMLKMATEFEMNGERKLRSVARLQGGQSRFEYVDDAHPDTLATMSAFDKFQIGIPVFWSGLGYRIQARLKYRNNSGKLSFWYELIRPDLVHQAAARQTIDAVRAGIGAVPLHMGTFSAT